MANKKMSKSKAENIVMLERLYQHGEPDGVKQSPVLLLEAERILGYSATEY